MDKRRKKTFSKLALILFTLSIILLFLLLLLQFNGVYILLGTPPRGISNQTLINLLILTKVISLTYLMKDKVLKGLVIVVGAFFILLSFLFISLIETDYTFFSSPNNQKNFVMVERGYGSLYQLSESKMYMVHLANSQTNNGYKPFSEGAYKLEWKEANRLVVHYQFDYMHNVLNRKIETHYK